MGARYSLCMRSDNGLLTSARVQRNQECNDVAALKNTCEIPDSGYGTWSRLTFFFCGLCGRYLRLR